MNALNEWSDTLEKYRIPRWNELPDMDLYMDQVIGLLDRYLAPIMPLDAEHFVTPSMINNYVKLRVLPAPIRKRYNREQLANLIVICLLKQVLSIPEIKTLLDLQLAEMDASAAYDAFCAAQEIAYRDIATKAKSICACGINEVKIENAAPFSASLPVETAVIASAHKALAQKLLAPTFSAR